MVDAAVVGIHRGNIKLDSNYVLEGNIAATATNPSPPLKREESPIFNLVIDHPEATILWDTGSHHKAGKGHWPSWLFDAFTQEDAAEHRLDDDLEANGYSISDIDVVIQTHLHMDHAGGLTFFEGTDIPVYVHKKEIKYAYYSANTGEGSNGYVKADFDLDINWQVVHRDHETHFKDIELLRLPGHTPGVLGLKIELSDQRTLIFTSDQCDLVINYKKKIPMGPGLIWNREAWFNSIHKLKELERKHNAQVIVGHDESQIETIQEGWQ